MASRALFPTLSLSIAVLAIATDFAKPSPSSTACRLGLCRFDQLYSRVDADGANQTNVGDLLTEDPSNPSAWCTYAELLARRGDEAGAQAAFAKAVALGPGMSPVLMRAANYAFSRGRWEDVFALSRRVLAQTGAYDQIIFSYFPRSASTVPRLLESSMPADPRAAASWTDWLKDNGTDQDLLDTWDWMRRRRLSQEESALKFTWMLWDRRRFTLAHQVWSDWLGDASKGELAAERIFNRDFRSQPNHSPFDWTLAAPESIELSRGAGLEVHFSGTGNVAFSGVHQFATVSAGRYRFSAEVESHGLNTDQRPLFHIIDAVPARKLDVETAPVAENAVRSWITLDFTVPPGMEAVEVELERSPSARFDGQIAGTLHVYEVSLKRL